MKTVVISLIGALTLGAALPALAGPDWQIIEQGRKAKLAHQQQAVPSPAASSFDSSGDSATKGNAMSGMPMHKCDDMKHMDMKGMDAKACEDMMKGMQSKPTPAATTHHATGVVKVIDPSKGTVTLAHGPVKSLQWPAMTMTFSVKDKALFDKLAVDKTVEIEFAQQGKNYVVTSVK